MRLIVFYIALLSISCTKNKDEISGYDYALFDDTPIENLAEAVEDNDTVKIRKLIEGGADIDFKEERFGTSLLKLTIYNRQFECFETLLKLGANPNLKDNHRSYPPLFYACKLPPKDNPVKYVETLIDYGCDVKTIGGNERTGKTTALILSIGPYHSSSSIYGLVSLLVENGVDVNFQNTINKENALGLSLIMKNHYIAKYLIENGASCDVSVFPTRKDTGFLTVYDYIKDQMNKPGYDKELYGSMLENCKVK